LALLNNENSSMTNNSSKFLIKPFSIRKESGILENNGKKSTFFAL